MTKILIDEATVKLALEALKKADSRDGYFTYITEIEALQEAQAQPAREPLTDDELADLWYKQSLDWMEFARAIEAAHGITKGNT